MHQRSASQAVNNSTSSSNSNNANASAPSTSTSTNSSETHHIRLVPHLESTRSLHFDPVSRDIQPTIPLRIGRFTDRNPNQPISSLDQNRIAFKSKVVSRTHAEIWYDPNPSTTNGASTAGGWFIRDLKSSSGTFLNHIRLSGAGMESRPFPIRDGDVLQLGVDYQGGTEEIYRCVKMRIELNRGWQRGANSFNDGMQVDKKTKEKEKNAASQASHSGVTDCCICLFSVTVYQALFIAPCSHIFHFKCIRPLLMQHHPGFSCPLCRTFGDLEADVEQDDVPEPIAEESSSSSSSSGESESDEEEGEEEAGNAAPAPAL
ncbi:hypothetical protein P389DRAFT_141488, partial [Cystobasidium minutum MCA 4210]|uniref:uncharacterized protein n=1 Tax=Cystobasidium minutum MCA 4210 TaxID=1397322 RepID=UPI0034CF49C7|eukprot:jgi/Rhomi1/141488/e_gw1.2.1627.1